MSAIPSRKRRNKTSTNEISAKLLKEVDDTTVKALIKSKKTETMSKNIKLTSKFFNQTSLALAKALLGKLLVHNVDGCHLKCRIIETELYPGGDDKGSVSYNNRRTPANEQVFMAPGTTWVYLTYGMYHCINISSSDNGGAVLLRAGEPVEGIEQMSANRLSKLKAKTNLKPKDLCNGPAKLCTAMCITKSTCNAINVGENSELWFEDDGYDCKEDEKQTIVSAKRVGIDRAGSDAVNQLWRFYYLNNPNVSKRDLFCEENMK